MCEELCGKFLHCCKFCDNRREIVLTEQGNPQKFRAVNNKQKKVCAVKIDKCIVQNEEIADFLLCVYENDFDYAYIVELKGSDIHKALNQIKAVINKFNIRMSIHCRVILKKNRAKIPSTYDTQEKAFLQYIKKIDKSSTYDRYRSESKIEKL